MPSYSPSSHSLVARDIIVAWAIALVILAIVLVMPEFVREHNAIGTEDGIKTAIEKEFPRNTDLFTNGPSSR